jgi:hypothetical protein
MSETTNAPEATPDVTATPEQIAQIEAYAPFWDVLKAKAQEANAARSQYKAATEGVEEAVARFLNESEDPKVAEFRTYREKVQEKIAALTAGLSEAESTMTKYASENVASSDVNADSLKEKYTSLRAVVNATEKNIALLLGGDAALLKAGMAHYGIEQVIGIGRTATSTGDTGIIRKKISAATIDGADVKDSNGKVTFTILASRLKTDGADVREAAAKAAGVESVKDIPNGQTVTFNVGKHTVTITTPESDD